MKWIDQRKPSLFNMYLRTVFLLLVAVALSLFLYETVTGPHHPPASYMIGQR
jgi:hypothetical protein